jgi:pimeloyl-ACP methyl ester carboxylesterase
MSPRVTWFKRVPHRAAGASRDSLRCASVVGLALVCLILLAAIFAAGYCAGFFKFRAMMTAAYRDIGRIVAPDGIDESKYVQLGKARQWIRIRGQSRHAPVLLFLHGGPGGAITPTAYYFQRPWEDDFVVVQWDQRGAGRSGIDGEALRGTLNKEQLVSDTIELLTDLNQRFGRKVVVVGQSWGTVLGIEVAKRRPDLVQLYVGMGQMTAWEPTFEESRRLLMQQARQTGDRALYDKLAVVEDKVPPFSDAAARERWAKTVDGETYRRGYSWHNFQGPGTAWGSRTIAIRAASPDESNGELIDWMRGVHRPLPPDIEAETERSVSGWSVEKDVGTRFEVPVFIVSGHYDWQVPITLARQLYDKVCAPYKMWVELPTSAHSLLYEEQGRLDRFLGETVLPAALGRVPDEAERCAAQPGAQSPVSQAGTATIDVGRKAGRVAVSERGEG